MLSVLLVRYLPDTNLFHKNNKWLYQYTIKDAFKSRDKIPKNITNEELM